MYQRSWRGCTEGFAGVPFRGKGAIVFWGLLKRSRLGCRGKEFGRQRRQSSSGPASCNGQYPNRTLTSGTWGGKRQVQHEMMVMAEGV